MLRVKTLGCGVLNILLVTEVRGGDATCDSSWWTMFRKVKKRHSSSSSQSSEISTKSKVKHTFDSTSLLLALDQVKDHLCFWMLVVCGLQFGRPVQVQHSRQSWHRLHQEFRSVFFSPSSPKRLLILSVYPPCHHRQQLVWSVCWVPGEVCGSDWEVGV